MSTEPSEFAIQALGLPTYTQLKERVTELEAALRDLRLTARVLLQNAQTCAVQHHGSTDEAGWLRDSRLRIEKAEALLQDFQKSTVSR